jgi:hypothetical protein
VRSLVSGEGCEVDRLGELVSRKRRAEVVIKWRNERLRVSGLGHWMQDRVMVLQMLGMMSFRVTGAL